MPHLRQGSMVAQRTFLHFVELGPINESRPRALSDSAILGAGARTADFAENKMLHDVLSQRETDEGPSSQNSDDGIADVYLTDDASTSPILSAVPCPVPPKSCQAHPAVAVIRPVVFVQTPEAVIPMPEPLDLNRDCERAVKRSRQRIRAKKTPRSTEEKSDIEARTTVMLRNLPRDYTREMFLQLLNRKGFKGRYDFLHMPIDFVRRACLGYAFVNVTSADVVPELWQAFDGFADWGISCEKICRVGWSAQGLGAHIQRFRNSPLLHPLVPDECKPVLLEGGVRVDFPPPTKPIRAPRLKASRQRNAFWCNDEADVEGFDGDVSDA